MRLKRTRDSNSLIHMSMTLEKATEIEEQHLNTSTTEDMILHIVIVKVRWHSTHGRLRAVRIDWQKKAYTYARRFEAIDYS